MQDGDELQEENGLLKKIWIIKRIHFYRFKNVYLKRVMSINLHRVLKNRRFYKYSSKTFLSDRKLESFSIKMQFNTFLSCFDQTMSNANIDIRHLLILINKQFWTMLSNSVSFRFWLAKINLQQKNQFAADLALPLSQDRKTKCQHRCIPRFYLYYSNNKKNQQLPVDFLLTFSTE